LIIFRENSIKVAHESQQECFIYPDFTFFYFSAQQFLSSEGKSGPVTTQYSSDQCG
jgi:hypothetical protein